VGIEQLYKLGKIRKRAGQPVDLVHQHNVDLAGANIGQELLQRWALERGAGERAIIVAGRDRPPAFVRLALDIGLARLALGIEGVEGKLKIVLGRLTRIDGAACELASGSVHAARRTRDGSSLGRVCGRLLGTANSSWRLSRTSPLHFAHRGRQLMSARVTKRLLAVLKRAKSHCGCHAHLYCYA
jgi:hypothetical protein